MGHELLGRAHAGLGTLRHDEGGQGTIEYVGLIMLMALVLAAVATFTGAGDSGKEIAEAIVGKLEQAIAGVGGGGKSG